jgi:hypothetical protein
LAEEGDISQGYKQRSKGRGYQSGNIKKRHRKEILVRDIHIEAEEGDISQGYTHRGRGGGY